jgi:hypothetical protein
VDSDGPPLVADHDPIAFGETQPIRVLRMDQRGRPPGLAPPVASGSACRRSASDLGLQAGLEPAVP